jgi:hypothetical protein
MTELEATEGPDPLRSFPSVENLTFPDSKFLLFQAILWSLTLPLTHRGQNESFHVSPEPQQSRGRVQRLG